MSIKLNGKIKFVLAMLVFGSIGIPVRFIGLPSGWLAMVRGLVGCLFLLALCKKPDVRAFKTNWKVLLFSGAAIGLNWICLFEAYRHTTVAVATLLYYLAPVLVLLFSPLILKEKLTLKNGFVITLALLGMVPVSGVFSGFSGSPRGIVMGLLAAALYASVMLANRFLKEIRPLERTVYQLGIAGLIVMPYALLREGFSLAWFDGKSLLLLAVVAILYTGVAYLFYFEGLGELSSSSAALLSYLDPVTALVLSTVVLGEKMTLLQGLGALLILGALLFGELPSKKKRN